MKNTVIVVDDSEMIRNIMINALQDEYNVVSAKDGREAIEAIRQNQDTIACVLLDLKMPVHDGFTVLEYLKNYKLPKKIPVYIISGDDSKDTVERAFNYDVIDMLNKPFSVDKIKDAVKRAINLSNK